MGVEVLMAAAAAVSAYGAYSQGQQQQEMMDFQAEQANADAKAASDEAVVQAGKIRKAMRAQQSQSTAALAASGVKVDEGTSLDINKDIYQRGEEDALTAIITGKYKSQSLNQEAQADRIAGSNAAASGTLSAAGSLLGGAAKVYGYKKG